ncbi:bifunctional DNA primase/polymerase [Streptomyces pactum]|uniref:bifunctional DNA primase/polymerase n=1 Tax=Streptomyces pactum TaxID=68249 RepID=UPI0036FB2CBD
MEETVEETRDVSGARGIPVPRGERPADAAVRYAQECHWDVVPGTRLVAGPGADSCSCGAARCPAPGAHPAAEDWQAQATGSAVVARRLWEGDPYASVLLPTGRTFDTLDVPESAGFLALARMERLEVGLGPVTWTPDRRVHFFVLPGAAPRLPELVRRLGWAPVAPDLVGHGEGDYVLGPPTRVGSHGAVQWVRKPTASNRWLPEAEELVGALAYACGR